MEPELAEIRELRVLVLALLDLARELRQGNDGDVEFLGQRLQRRRDLGDFLHAVLGRASRGADEELDIVDDQQVEAALALEPAGAGSKLRDGETAGLVDVEGDALHLARGLDDTGEIAFVDAATADIGR